MFRVRLSCLGLSLGLSTGLAAGLGLTVVPALAQDFPTREVRITVPSSPAGITDIASRVIGQALSVKWGKQVIVENKPGGGGTIGVLSASRATADGYTLLATTNGELALHPAISSKTPYDANKDFVPIAMATNNPILLVANASAPYNTLADVVAAAKKAPGSISWASPGVGTWNHLTGEWLADALGIKMVHVPYRGGGPAGVAVAAGDVPLGVVAISSALPHVQSGRMKVIALTSGHRSKFNMSWPTVSETLVPGFDSMQWVGLYAPAAIDPALRTKIEADVLAVLAQPDVRERFEKAGAEVVGRSGADATKQLAVDAKIAREIAAKANIHID
jgi:tripartite-type tricarboxylate transporter receptor subunit TctC